MKKFLFLTFALAATPAFAAENWQVREGDAKDAPSSTWTMNIQGTQAVGNGEGLVDGKIEKFSVFGQLRADGYTLQTKDHGASDKCLYHGKATPDGASIVGTRTCGTVNKPWLVTIRR